MLYTDLKCPNCGGRKNGIVIIHKGKKYTAKQIQELTGYSLGGIYKAYHAGDIERLFFGKRNRVR